MNDIKLPIVEIFDSIQGEGIQMGFPVTFIRTSGCNLQCPWCDTKESWKIGDNWKTISEILDMVNQLHVVITGGEPTIHIELNHLIRALKDEGHFISIETNGTNPVYKEVDWVTCSPKPETSYLINNWLRVDELKYVVDANFDAEDAIPEEVREQYAGRIWLQPEGNNMEESFARCVELTKLDGRLRVGIQMHKVMGVK